MNKHVLVINSGSSSIKYQLLDPNAEVVVASGLVEQIGEHVGHVTHTYRGVKTKLQGPISDHAAGFELAYQMFADAGLALADAGIAAIGHRLVHGGEVFSKPTLITPEVVAEIDRLSDLAPLHNPPNVIGIRVAQEHFPDLPHVGVFDTGFFHTLSRATVTYAIDREVAKKYGVRRYGFHGTSHQYVSQQVAKVLGKPLSDVNTIVLHLGNGASASAVRGGIAVDTSMGLTPLEGLVMGTRPGDIDPGALLHLGRAARMDVAQLDELLNKRSGLKGLSGDNDFRELMEKLAAGDECAKLAYDVYAHRLRKYVGAYLAVLGRVDAIAFTAGVGENVAAIRADALSGLEPLGIEIDAAANVSAHRGARIISTPISRTKVLIVPTNEELAIAKAAWEFVRILASP